jgi:hypothetical protein
MRRSRSLLSKQLRRAFPLIVPELNGIEEIIQDGENGIIINCTAEGIASGLERVSRSSTRATRKNGSTSALSCRYLRRSPIHYQLAELILPVGC